MSDSFSQYLTEAARYPLLNKTQEIMLARQVQIWLNDENATARQKVVGRRAYEKLINCNLRLVVSVSCKCAHKFPNAHFIIAAPAPCTGEFARIVSLLKSPGKNRRICDCGIRNSAIVPAV